MNSPSWLAESIGIVEVQCWVGLGIMEGCAKQRIVFEALKMQTQAPKIAILAPHGGGGVVEVGTLAREVQMSI